MIDLEDAACQGSDPELFRPFPHDYRAIGEARAVCGRCPTRLDCLVLALDTPGAQGIWGGLTQPERAGHRRQQRLRNGDAA
jgi:WhiB family transcriptional regulator, redox-sensing transcriptional regulator